jgi:hypothetical protein
MREELSQSFEHLRFAAAHAATGAANTIAPRFDAARAAVKPGLRKARGKTSDGVDPVFGAARSTTRQAKGLARKSTARVTKKESAMAGRRWPVVISGLVVAGAAAGAIGALVKRRRAQRSWDEYDSTRSTTGNKAMLDTAKTSMDAGISRVSSAASTAKDRASDLIGSTTTSSSERTSTSDRPSETLAGSTMASSPSRTGEFKQQKDDMFTKPGPATPSTAKNSRP